MQVVLTIGLWLVEIFSFFWGDNIRAKQKFLAWYERYSQNVLGSVQGKIAHQEMMDELAKEAESEDAQVSPQFLSGGSGKPKYYEIARQEIGVKEISGSKHNNRVLEYHATTTLKATTDEVAWCSSFVNWCLTQAGLLGTNSAAARSWLKWGKPVGKPYEGCIVVFQRGNSSWQGHVGFFVRETSTHVFVLGGNQANAVNERAYSKSSLLGYRAPA